MELVQGRRMVTFTNCNVADSVKVVMTLKGRGISPPADD